MSSDEKRNTAVANVTGLRLRPDQPPGMGVACVLDPGQRKTPNSLEKVIGTCRTRVSATSISPEGAFPALKPVELVEAKVGKCWMASKLRSSTASLPVSANSSRMLRGRATIICTIVGRLSSCATIHRRSWDGPLNSKRPVEDRPQDESCPTIAQVILARPH